MTQPGPATMAQIAERAGVALGTVSYVLSGKRSVSQKTRERVLSAIEERPTSPQLPPRQHLIGAELVVRESTGPPPRRVAAARRRNA